MCGTEVIRKICKMPGTKPMIVAFTAKNTPFDKELLIANGADVFLNKSISNTEFIKTIIDKYEDKPADK